MALLRPFHSRARASSVQASRTAPAPASRHSRLASSTDSFTSRAWPSSSISSTAAASRGYSSTPKESLTAWMQGRSIISMPAGSTPALVISRTASPAASIEAKSASSTATVSGARNSRSVMAVAMPRVPSLPMNTPRRSRPPISGRPPPRVVTLPSGNTTSMASTWLLVTPYFRQCTPPEFSATLPPMLQATWLEGSGA